jgi:lipoprotein-anchoring transpeptidase ErfK/SrfK
VPDVPEFSIADVQALDKQRAAAAKKKSAEPQPIATQPPGPPPQQLFDLNAPVSDSLETPQPAPAVTPAPPPAPEPDRRLVLLRAERLIEVYEGDRIVACFPCTPGSAKFPVPEGTWKITSNTLMPYFRWDKSVLETGVRSENAHLLPPGPNSPVGIVWMGINRPSLGIHGTNSPDRIGRNESSGCIRLANWDAFLLCQLVKKGTPVEVR